MSIQRLRSLILAFGSILGAFGSPPRAHCPLPWASFTAVPDDFPGSSTASVLAGQVPGPSGLVAVQFDFTADFRLHEMGYFTAQRTMGNRAVFDPIDLRLLGRDPSLGATLLITRDATQAASWIASNPGGAFYPGDSFSASIPVIMAASGAGLDLSMPTSGLLTLNGTFQPGYFHQFTIATGAIDTLPSATVSVRLKEDLFVPNIEWHYTCRAASSSAARSPGGLPEPIQGRFSIRREAVDETTYTVGPVALELPSLPTPVVIVIPALGGTLSLDPMTRTVTGQLSGTVDGVPFTRTLDGVGEWFVGSSLQPANIHIEEAGLPGLDTLTLDLRRTELVPEGSVPLIGSLYQPVFRALPGVTYAAAASLTPGPGISTPAGDVFVSIDILFDFSTMPGNGIFSDFLGVMPANGEQILTIAIPNEPLLTGFIFHIAGIIIDPGLQIPLGVTNSHRVTLQ